MRTPGTGEEHDGHREEQQPRQRARLRNAIRLAVAVAAALASLYWLSRYADLGAIVPLVQKSHRSALIGAVILLLISLGAKSLRWHALLPSGSPLSRVEAFQIFHVSVLLNNLLPFRAGDSFRVLSPAVRRSVPARHAILILIAERLVDSAALIAVASVVLPMAGPRLTRGLDLGGAAPLLVVAGIAGLAVAALAVSASLRGRLQGILLAIRATIVNVVVYERPRAWRILTWTVLAWIGTFWLHYLLLDALDIRATLLLAIVVTLSTNFAMIVPATPANIGVFHAAAAAPLIAIGTPPELSVAYAVLVHAVNTVPAIAVGAACLAVSLARARVPSMLARARG